MAKPIETAPRTGDALLLVWRFTRQPTHWLPLPEVSAL
jgi:hypothetical protein